VKGLRNLQRHESCEALCSFLQDDDEFVSLEAAYALADASPKKYRQAGTMKGMFTMAEDFDAPLEDFKDYM